MNKIKIGIWEFDLDEMPIEPVMYDENGDVEFHINSLRTPILSKSKDGSKTHVIYGFQRTGEDSIVFTGKIVESLDKPITD